MEKVYFDAPYRKQTKVVGYFVKSHLNGSDVSDTGPVDSDLEFRYRQVINSPVKAKEGLLQVFIATRLICHN